MLRKRSNQDSLCTAKVLRVRSLESDASDPMAKSHGGFGSLFLDFYKSGLYHDVLFHVNERDDQTRVRLIPAHRVVVAAVSAPLKQAIANAAAKAQAQGSYGVGTHYVPFEALSVVAFEAAIDLIYYGSVITTRCFANLLLRQLVHLDIPSVVDRLPAGSPQRLQITTPPFFDRVQIPVLSPPSYPSHTPSWLSTSGKGTESGGDRQDPREAFDRLGLTSLPERVSGLTELGPTERVSVMVAQPQADGTIQIAIPEEVGVHEVVISQANGEPSS